jgi:hypothetical protein
MKNNWFSSTKPSRFFIRISHWEYWPFAVVYFPIYPVWLWYAFKSRAFFFFGPSNPGIRNEGFIMESKKEIYDHYPRQRMPATILVEASSNIREVLQAIEDMQIQFPIIAKPDIGMQGIGVYILTSQNQLIVLLDKIQIRYILQPFVPYDKEMGIFFIRTKTYPKGFISGIVEKVFLEVTGDGSSSIRQLLASSKRFSLQLPSLEKALGPRLEEILPAGEKEVLVPFGNHARGAMFLDVTKELSALLTPVMQQQLSSAPDFYYGRLDIRYHSLEDLINNKHWAIIEMNGAGSEPTHMYDPSHTIIKAWKEIIKHWHWLYKVSKENRKTGHKDISFREGLKMYKAFKKYRKLLMHHKELEIRESTLRSNTLGDDEIQLADTNRDLLPITD